MAGNLSRVRIAFVEQVSLVVIQQLLDDILQDGILSRGQSEAILEKNPTRAGKARQLIDTVITKGDRASLETIGHLQRRDPKLSSLLGLTPGQPGERGSSEGAAAGAAPPPSSSGLIPCTPDFWKKKQHNDDIYPVTRESKQNRVALLITNINFSDPEVQDRAGAQKDRESMKALLQDLGYEVLEHTNCTAEQMTRAMVDFSEHTKLQKTDSVFVVLMSHGKRGRVLGVDWKKRLPPGEPADEFLIDDIYKHLGPDRCPHLLDKPKVIVIQACRGEKEGSLLVWDAPVAPRCAELPQEDLQEDAVRFVNQEKDFTSLLSCTPDTVSYRHPQDGSFLIQYFVEVFNHHACEDHIEELFRKVLRRFEKDFSKWRKRQMACKDRGTMARLFYLFPGL